MEDEGPLCPKGETKSGVTHKNQVDASNGNKGCNKCKWGQGKSMPQGDKEKLMGLIKNPPFYNYIFNYNSTTNKVENYTYSCNLFFATGKYFLQFLTNNVEKYKSNVKL